jgi:hypothetical protein
MTLNGATSANEYGTETVFVVDWHREGRGDTCYGQGWMLTRGA